MHPYIFLQVQFLLVCNNFFFCDILNIFFYSRKGTTWIRMNSKPMTLFMKSTIPKADEALKFHGVRRCVLHSPKGHSIEHIGHKDRRIILLLNSDVFDQSTYSVIQSRQNYIAVDKGEGTFSRMPLLKK